MAERYVLLAILWLSWCLLHSLLIARFVTRFLRRLPEGITRYYRLAYTITALSTLLPLIVYTRYLQDEIVFVWQGGWVLVRFCLLGISCGAFYGGARRYDMGYFLGLRQIISRKAHALLSENEDFTRKGVFGITRHPWYLGSLILLWSVLPVYHVSTFITAVILSLYLVVGTILEERKIIAEFGESYRAYQQEVSMLVPWKWLHAAIIRRNH